MALGIRSRFGGPHAEHILCAQERREGKKVHQQTEMCKCEEKVLLLDEAWGNAH